MCALQVILHILQYHSTELVANLIRYHDAVISESCSDFTMPSYILCVGGMYGNGWLYGIMVKDKILVAIATL